MLVAGIPLSTVLCKLGVKSVSERAAWVHFAGPEDEMPGNNSYATCLDLDTCLDPAHDVLLAYKQNGRWGWLHACCLVARRMASAQFSTLTQ